MTMTPEEVKQFGEHIAHRCAELKQGYDRMNRKCNEMDEGTTSPEVYQTLRKTVEQVYRHWKMLEKIMTDESMPADVKQAFSQAYQRLTDQ